jgi:hypothetical protein
VRTFGDRCGYVTSFPIAASNKPFGLWGEFFGDAVSVFSNGSKFLTKKQGAGGGYVPPRGSSCVSSPTARLGG